MTDENGKIENRKRFFVELGFDGEVIITTIHSMKTDMGEIKQQTKTEISQIQFMEAIKPIVETLSSHHFDQYAETDIKQIEKKTKPKINYLEF